jgi:RNase P subunit RPR2
MTTTPVTCRHCDSEYVEDVTTYNDTVVSERPCYRFKCKKCGKFTRIPVNEYKEA